MSKNFKLSGLIPNPLTFTDDEFGGDGHTHDVKSTEMLSSAEFAELERIKADIGAFLNQPEGGTSAGLRIYEQRTDEFMQILIPTLTEVRRSVIPIAFKIGFLTWWQQQQPRVEPSVGKAPARAAKTPRGRSRASSEPTTSTPARSSARPRGSSKS